VTYDVWDETPSMTIDGRRAVITNGIVTWLFRCTYCRQVEWRATFAGQVTIGMLESGKAARWFQQERPGPKPVPEKCEHCGETQARAAFTYSAREAAGCISGPKVKELLDYAWRHFRATLPPAEIAAADRRWGIR
jgi:hypothetical protein